MCLAVPMKVKQVLEEGTATVEFGSITRRVNIQLLNDVKQGDYLIVHAGVAIEKLETEEAERMLEILCTLDNSSPSTLSQNERGKKEGREHLE